MTMCMLPISILNCRAEPPPMRELELECQVTNPTQCDICILDAWVEVEASNGLKLAEGKVFKSMYNRTDPAIIPRGEKGLGSFHIHLSSQTLHDIEEQRVDGDVKLVFSSRVLVSTIVNDMKALAPPFETSFMDSGNDRFEYLIPQSEWIKLLKSLRWSELELLEIPASRLRVIPVLARSLSRFEDAQNCFRQLDWEETMLNCRKAFEAIVQDKSGTSDMRQSRDVIISLVGEGDKAERIDKLTKSLSDFLQLGRHENLPHISIKRSDAELALRLTGALLSYFGQ